MKFTLKTIFILIAVAGFLILPIATANDSDTTLSWVVPANFAHSIAYGGSCNASAMYFIEADGTIDGTDVNLIPYSAASAGTVCQSAALTPIKITNSGNVIIDINARTSAALTSGVTLKMWLGNGGCGTGGLGGSEDTCSKSGAGDATVATQTACVAVTDSVKQIVADLATSTDQNLCLSAAFSGVAQGTNTSTLKIGSWTSTG